MNKFAFGVAAAITAGTFGLAAIAQDANNNTNFEDADFNDDGVISWEEAVDYYPKASEALFAQVDLDGDGVLTVEEFSELGLLIYPNPLSPGAQIDQEKRDENSSSDSSMSSDSSSQDSSSSSQSSSSEDSSSSSSSSQQ